MKKLFTAMTAAWLLLTLPLTSYAAEKQLFPDVPPSKHFAESVNNLAERNIIGGYPDGSFKPSNPITRGQAAAIIAKMIKLDTANVKNPNFKDVSTANGYYKAIAALAEKGIIGGYPDGKYGPNNPITRGQMASIIVKAFDLPRIPELKHPFTDVSTNGRYSHDESILIIYKLGITTGTTPTTFSPNANITRSQAAKLLKTAEENKPPMVMITASELRWQSMTINQSDAVSIEGDGKDGLFYAIKIHGKAGYTEDRVQLVPLKEGKGVLNLQGVPVKGASVPDYKKYYVHIKKVNNELKLTLEETAGTVPTDVTLRGIDKEIKSIALSAMEGKLLDADIPFKAGPYQTVSFKLDKPGQYIADVTLKDGKKLRYGAEAVQEKELIYFNTRAIKERLEVVYEEKSADFAGKYSIEGTGAEEIADISYDPKTKTFTARAAGRKEGYVDIYYQGQTLYELLCDDKTPECRDAYSGIFIHVEKIGSIISVSAGLTRPV